ncbi:hypothetical protein SYK_11740 [Pseudodesulfovibrio nedwellii]|uniref:DUF2680 domain-containing protein n=1 Tax=Pseudodesulfovibrio nedwellii TaxID=2973072 RepID=A0ABM8AZ55_9BACT|nr:hypothetical protein [Pseudodesulfovibrio nedwellii]BDQ36814.1 hypothetical protein SYK_11740 [Pseudodesulfovibrio nedwellii]
MKHRIIIACMFTMLAIPINTALAQGEPIFTQEELIGLVGEAVVQETTEASDEVRKAKEILDAMRKEGTVAEQQQAQTNVENAEKKFTKAQGKLDEARVDAFARESGKSPADIQAMRDSGMGWGRIAKETNVHPSTSGKGKGKTKNKGKGKGKNSGNSTYADSDDDMDENETTTYETDTNNQNDEELDEASQNQTQGKDKSKGKSNKSKGKDKKK